MTNLRLGLCCAFANEPIRFKATTAKTLALIPRAQQLASLSALCRYNAATLLQAVHAVKRLGIGAFRVLSPIFPRSTHPAVGYTLEDLPDAPAIAASFREVRLFCADNDIRLSFHPDQFISLSSLRLEVTVKSIQELEYQGSVAELIGAEVINLHGGGAQGGKPATLARLAENISSLSTRIRQRLTLENDDTIYTVRDLLPLCHDLAIPLVYDVHHHRCNPDGLTVEEATSLAMATWVPRAQQPWFHVSSPKNGWDGGAPRSHADYLDPGDFPACWHALSVTVDVEAKAKELAVLRLKRALQIV